MIRAIGHASDGRKILILGLDARNLERLRSGEPILVVGAQRGLDFPGDVAILYGRTLLDVARDMRRHELVDDAYVASVEAALRAQGMDVPTPAPAPAEATTPSSSTTPAPAPPPMSFERACELADICYREVLWRSYGIGPEQHLPQGVSLEDLLVANRLVEEDNDRVTDDFKAGRAEALRARPTVEPRLVALAYAFEHYGSDPIELLRALEPRRQLPDA